MRLPLLTLVRDDPLVGTLVVASLETAGGLAPRRDRMTAARRFALTASMRMVDGVHRDAAIVRRLAQPASPSRFTQRDVFVVQITNLPHGRHALRQHAPHFTRRQLQQRDAAFFRNQLCLRSRRARHLGALAGLQLDIVDNRAGRHVLHRQGITQQNIGSRTGHHFLPDLQPVGLNDVPLLAIGVMQQGDTRRAVGIVLDGCDHSRDAKLIALEIDHPVGLLGAAADESRSDPPGAVASASALFGFHQRLLGPLLRNVVTRRYRLKAPRRRRRPVCFYRHSLNSAKGAGSQGPGARDKSLALLAATRLPCPRFLIPKSHSIPQSNIWPDPLKPWLNSLARGPRLLATAFRFLRTRAPSARPSTSRTPFSSRSDSPRNGRDAGSCRQTWRYGLPLPSL